MKIGFVGLGPMGAHNGVMNRDDFDHLVDVVVVLVQRLDASAVARVRDFTPAS